MPTRVDEGAVVDDGLGYWRARLLDAAWAVLLLGGAVTVVPGLVRAWVDRDVGYLAWVLGSVTLVAVVLRRNVPYTPKAVALVGIAYAAGVASRGSRHQQAVRPVRAGPRRARGTGQLTPRGPRAAGTGTWGCGVRVRHT